MGEGKPLERVSLRGRTPWGRRGALLATQGGVKQGAQPSRFPGWRLPPPDSWPHSRAQVKLFIAQDFISKSNTGRALCIPLLFL